MKLPEHISYSQLHSYEECPRAWYLSYLRRGEELQAWYIAVGSAVHHMVEDWLDLKKLGASPQDRKAEDYLYPLVAKQMQVEPDLSKWLAGGPKDDPTTGDKALQLVRDCFERALEFLDDIDVWEVEYDASGSLPGLSVPVKAFVDIIGEYRGKVKKAHGPMIVDWKTGKTKPGNFQLETYAALLKGDDRFKDLKFRGMYAMLAPTASVARPIDLSEVDSAAIGARYQKAREGMEHMQIQARENRSKFTCGMCFQSANCAAWNKMPTKRSSYYDKSAQDQPPF